MINKQNQKHKKSPKKTTNIKIPSNGHEQKCIGMMNVCEFYVWYMKALGIDGLTHACIEGSQLIRSRENKPNRQIWMERHENEKT